MNLKTRWWNSPIQSRKNRKNEKSEDSLTLWHNIKQINNCIVGNPERKETEKGAENLFEEKNV